MNTLRDARIADALAHLGDADQVFVRLALSREDAASATTAFRSLAIDVLPQAWLDHHDASLLAPWLKDQLRFECRTAFFFCDFLKSSIVRAWFEHPDDCGLTGFDDQPGCAPRRVGFSIPELHDHVSVWHVGSYSPHGAKPIPYPSAIYELTPKPPKMMNFRDDERLVGEEGQTFPSFRAARAELIYGVTDRHSAAYSRDDLLSVRVVDARGWLKEVRVRPDSLVVTVGGTEVLRDGYLVAQGAGVNEKAPVRNHQLSLPLPPQITGQVEVILLGGGTDLDAVSFYGLEHPSPYGIHFPQVIVEREDVAGYVQPVGAQPPTYAPAAVLRREESGAVRPKVFISYSHDSAAHQTRVLQFANRLRQEGIECHIDQYIKNPPEGWPRWMKNQIEWADCVLVVCTEAYCQRFNDQEEPGKGLGTAWEGQFITQTIYEQAGNNDKFIPVVFASEDINYIPMPLRPTTRYNLAVEAGYEELYARLTDQTLTEIPALGEIRKLEPREQ